MQKIITIASVIALVLISGFLVIGLLPSMYEAFCKTRNYDNFKISHVMNSNVLILEEEEKKSCGMGVVIRKEENTYYLLTASKALQKDKTYLARTYDIITYSGNDDPEELKEYYDSYPKLELLKTKGSLALMRFTYKTPIPVAKISMEPASKNEKVCLIGNPRFELSGKSADPNFIKYGRISKIGKETMSTSTYTVFKDIGAGLFNEKEELVGICIGVKQDPFHRFQHGIFVPVNHQMSEE